MISSPFNGKPMNDLGVRFRNWEKTINGEQVTLKQRSFAALLLYLRSSGLYDKDISLKVHIDCLLEDIVEIK